MNIILSLFLGFGVMLFLIFLSKGTDIAIKILAAMMMFISAYTIGNTLLNILM